MKKMTFKLNDYILFVSSDANFQTKSMIVPAREFMEIRSDHIEILRKYAYDVTCTNSKKEQINVHNFLKRELIPCSDNNNGWTTRQTEWSPVWTDIMKWMNGDKRIELIDQVWWKKTKVQLAKGKNHVQNWNRLNKMTSYQGKSIRIIESFLSLEFKVT